MNTYRKKIEQYGRKNLGHVSGYVSRERGATVTDHDSSPDLWHK